MSDKNTGRYSVSSDEDMEPGSDGTVLKNYLGIRSKDEIEAVEEQELRRAELRALQVFTQMVEVTQKVLSLKMLQSVWSMVSVLRLSV